nr:RHS repeat-associated core domain-containing protein [uncultured Prevotella sp.]
MRKFTSLLLLGFALGSFAQTPGGVSGSELWFKTAPLNSDLQGYYRWQDFSGDSIRLMLLDSRGVKSELTLPNSSVHYFNFNPSLWLADGFRSLSASLKHGDLSQATVIGVFAPELATIGKDMVVYALDGRKGDGAILSKDKAVRGRGVEPLDYGSASGEDLLYQSSDSLSENGFKESALRVVSYFKVSNPSTTLWGDNSNTTLFIGTPSSSGSFGTDFPTSLFGNASIRGYAPELIVFSRMLTPDERRKVESYLAVKYGITLKGSYLDSDGNLTWDMAENQAYHHRVTAVGTDTAGSLSQPLSATSYEESPVYAALKENGTYHDANPYNPSSASRLLVMGRENGNPMPDRGFTFWGDDDVALATYTSPTDSLWHVMKRTWMVKTNVPSKPDSTVARWTAQGFEVSRNGFTDNIIQEKAASGAYATTPGLVGGGGAFEFTCPTSHPTFDVGFGSIGGSTCKYGFRFTNAGVVYPIINGAVSNSYIATDVDGTDISIRKEGKNIYLRVDGTGSATRTISLSDATYVNSEFAGGRTNTAKFSLYVSPYLVANQGGRYTKHIYIGSQRVVSKIGDFDSYGSDPRRIQYAGSETDGLSVDYKGKYTQQLQVIKDNYATFAVPYNGEDNNDYVDGKGFCCNDGSLEAAQARAMARAAKNNFQEGDTYEKMQFYYHPDHLGSSSYITNLDGEVVQHIEYVPFGEVFIEERNNIWNTPYLFNAKEFDEETGLYYYGARYYDPRVSLWISTDILEEKNYGNSSYAYTYNPITFIDPIGTDTINISYVNKKWKIDAPIIADGNDVFNVANGDKKETYEFSQGEHGKRVNLLNLEIGETKDSYTLGVYHISGEADNGTGFYVAPGGEPSTKNGSGRRIPDGTYPIINPTAGSQWIKPGVGGNVSKRGIRFHYGGTNPRSWTEGCFVLSSGYSVNGNTIHYNADESKTASRNFDNALGAIGHFSYRPKSRTYNREGATFNAPIKHTLILKSRKK